MPEAEDWKPTTVQLGPALVDVPSDWEIQDSGKRGTVVLTMPLGRDAAMQQLRRLPGFIQPNLVLRFFTMPADQGGVARAAGDELRAALHRSPGASLIAVTPLSTQAGFPGRAQLIVGTYQRVPFQMSRWYLGVGDTVVEVVLTLPSTVQPDLLQLGERVAQTVRPDPTGSEADASGDSSLPTIEVVLLGLAPRLALTASGLNRLDDDVSQGDRPGVPRAHTAFTNAHAGLAADVILCAVSAAAAVYGLVAGGFTRWSLPLAILLTRASPLWGWVPWRGQSNWPTTRLSWPITGPAPGRICCD